MTKSNFKFKAIKVYFGGFIFIKKFWTFYLQKKRYQKGFNAEPD